MSYFDNLKDEDEIVFLSLAELGWEIGRWSAPINYFIKNNPDKKYIIATLNDRIDLYKGYHEYFSIKIEGLYSRKRPDMYKIHFMDPNEYDSIINSIKRLYPNAFICSPPKGNPGRYVFSNSEIDFDFQPRPQNKNTINSILNGRNTPVITIASRHRRDCQNRNWPEDYWHQLFSKLSNFTVLVVGTGDAYIKPNLDYCICVEDYNTDGTSTIGLVIEAMKASKVTIGQQSGNPILSLLLGTPVISWGHEKQRHSMDENILRTPCHFFEDPEYKIEPQIIYQKILEVI